MERIDRSLFFQAITGAYYSSNWSMEEKRELLSCLSLAHRHEVFHPSQHRFDYAVLAVLLTNAASMSDPVVERHALSLLLGRQDHLPGINRGMGEWVLTNRLLHLTNQSERLYGYTLLSAAGCSSPSICSWMRGFLGSTNEPLLLRLMTLQTLIESHGVSKQEAETVLNSLERDHGQLPVIRDAVRRLRQINASEKRTEPIEQGR